MKTPQNNIEQYLTKAFFLNPAFITDNKTFERDFGLNFSEFFEVVAHLENHYQISLPDESISPKLSLRQLSKIVTQNVSNSQMTC
jgi:acyl carrier protein